MGKRRNPQQAGQGKSLKTKIIKKKRSLITAKGCVRVGGGPQNVTSQQGTDLISSLFAAGSRWDAERVSNLVFSLFSALLDPRQTWDAASSDC